MRPNSPFTTPDAEDDAESGKEKVYETLREKSEKGRDEDSVADIMKVWGSSGARRINDGAGPMMLLPKVSNLHLNSTGNRAHQVWHRSTIHPC